MHHLHANHDQELQVLRTFRSSQAFGKIIPLLVSLSDGTPFLARLQTRLIFSIFPASVGVTVPEALARASDRVRKILNVIQKIQAVVARVEPVQTASRFGNAAFRTVQTELEAINLLEEFRSDLSPDAKMYLLASLGDFGRIDYGTGHELNFVCFLSVLRDAGEIDESDFCSIAMGVFSHYFQLVRTLQKRYFLEPAGSRGCWGLDDYQFIPYLFGAAQLSSHPHLRPKSVCSEEIRQDFSRDYMYIEAVNHVHVLKVSSFAEHSPMLYDITAVKKWSQVHTGLLSMYNREVLGKHAIMQHFKYSESLSSAPLDEQELARVEALLPVSAADRRLGPILKAAEQPHIPCCGDAIQFPSSLPASGK